VTPAGQHEFLYTHLVTFDYNYSPPYPEVKLRGVNNFIFSRLLTFMTDYYKKVNS
jgi:hypothetical protein